MHLWRETIVSRRTQSPANKRLTSLLARGGLALFILLASLTVDANGQAQPDHQVSSFVTQVTHILGFEDALTGSADAATSNRHNFNSQAMSESEAGL